MGKKSQSRKQVERSLLYGVVNLNGCNGDIQEEGVGGWENQELRLYTVGKNPIGGKSIAGPSQCPR